MFNPPLIDVLQTFLIDGAQCTLYSNIIDIYVYDSVKTFYDLMYIFIDQKLAPPHFENGSAAPARNGSNNREMITNE